MKAISEDGEEISIKLVRDSLQPVLWVWSLNRGVMVDCSLHPDREHLVLSIERVVRPDESVPLGAAMISIGGKTVRQIFDESIMFFAEKIAA